MIKVKRKPRYRVTIYDENHLVDRGGFSFTWWRFSLAAAGIGIFFILAGVAIVWFTPLKESLPGYMPVSQRSLTEEAYLTADSLSTVYARNQAYLDNIATILDTDREPRQTLSDTMLNPVPLILDSLMMPTEVEKEFVRKLEAEGYIVTPLPDSLRKTAQAPEPKDSGKGRKAKSK